MPLDAAATTPQCISILMSKGINGKPRTLSTGGLRESYPLTERPDRWPYVIVKALERYVEEISLHSRMARAAGEVRTTPAPSVEVWTNKSEARLSKSANCLSNSLVEIAPCAFVILPHPRITQVVGGFRTALEFRPPAP